jgi:hypothetical protein
MDLIEINKSNKHRHPWEISRRRSLIGILKSKSITTQYADIGAGDQFFTKGLEKLTQKPIYVVDANYESENKNPKSIQYTKLSELKKNVIDHVVLLDVLEHVENESLFLKEINSLLTEDGEILLTVPAFQFLYCEHDVFLRHKRRYNLKGLKKLLINNGYEIKRYFYFYTLLFFFRTIEKILFRNAKKGIGNWKFSNRNLITIIISFILSIDFYINRVLSKCGLFLPGLSICLTCQKRADE